VKNGRSQCLGLVQDHPDSDFNRFASCFSGRGLLIL